MANPYKSALKKYASKERLPKAVRDNIDALEAYYAEKYVDINKYNPVVCDLIVDLMSQGFSITAACGEIGLSRDTVYQWANAHEALAYALKHGQAKRVAHLERSLHAAAAEGNAAGVRAAESALRGADPIWNPHIRQQVDAVVTHAPTEFNEELRGALDAVAAKLSGNFTLPSSPALAPAMKDEDEP
ncbi:helix-turn-helix domain-containing protein [Xanthobacter oligotrophicus]|uniref:Helix-turn-helix domain-containing protein n=1 Tax=Xanthobacter oligotrophicus TaxID=2607286 RepID=A0ABW6ZSY9_9HYPH